MNFALILFVLVVVTGVLWAFDVLVTRKRRPKKGADPWWVEYGASFFPVILLVFVLRSFVVEPFKIPSGSMIPTLLVGDFILVNKYTYGVRLPVLNAKVVDVGLPQRGDVMVFRYPLDPSLDYIKRVVGLPGDRVAYQNKRLTINGVDVPVEATGEYLHPEKLFSSQKFSETLGEVTHEYLNDADAPAYILQAYDYPFRDNCLYNRAGVICTVPSGHYFVLGDNRDDSKDGRFWGFVPEENIVGKAFFIWMNLGDMGRIGAFK